jgi:hypothetical protein
MVYNNPCTYIVYGEYVINEYGIVNCCWQNKFYMI